MDYTAFGKVIKQYRKLKHMTQMNLAEKTELSVSHISNMENGKSEASIDSLVRLSNVLDIGADQLLCDSLEHSSEVYRGELGRVFEDCGKEELQMLVELVKTARPWVQKNLEKKPVDGR